MVAVAPPEPAPPVPEPPQPASTAARASAASIPCKVLRTAAPVCVVRFSVMKTPMRVLLLLLLLAVASFAAAQDSAVTVIDSGRFVVLNHGRKVAVEAFEFLQSGDSVVISSATHRIAPGGTNPESIAVKRMSLRAGAFDFGLRNYTSNFALNGHTVVKGVVPGDLAMTVYTEFDGAGDASRLEQPPGRLFIMDPMLFTLFDVICHNLSGKTFTSRPLQMLFLGDSARVAEATVENGGPDTLLWGARRTPARRFTVSDPSGRFTVWMNAQGGMLKLEHAASGLVVLREAPVAPKPVRKTAGGARR